MKKETAAIILNTTSVGTYNEVVREYLSPEYAPNGNPDKVKTFIRYYYLDTRKAYSDKQRYDLVCILARGDREYMRGGCSGNYLTDFLQVHGEEVIDQYHLLNYSGGDPTEAGKGFWIQNLIEEGK